MATTMSRKKSAPKKSAPKKVRAGRGGGVNKSAFIREQPATMSAKDVVAAGKKAGIELTEGFVYNARSNAKAKGKTVAKRGPGRSTTAPRADEAAFRALVVSLGTARARALVDEVEAKLAAVISGN